MSQTRGRTHVTTVTLLRTPSAQSGGPCRDPPLALLAAGPGRGYTVEFTLKPGREDQQGQEILEEIRKELDFHLVELDEPDPWAYARYHCNTVANALGSIRWALHKKHE